MESVENILYNYIDSFFDNEAEKYLFNLACSLKLDDISDVDDWIIAENKLKSMLPYQNSGLTEFYVKLQKNASTFIKQLFDTIDSDTFVLGVAEHQTIKDCLESTKNKQILHYNIIQTLDVNSIVDKIKNSRCTKVFVYLTGIIETHVLPQAFCICLKQALLDANIQHTIVLDDVQGMFVVPRDYSIFDYVIYTCHSLVSHFDCGILLTKSDFSFGYTNAKIIEQYLPSLNLVLSKLNKFNTLKYLIKQYLIEEINSNCFSISNDSTPMFLYFNLDKNSKKIFVRYKDILQDYEIEVEDMIIQIKMNFLLRNSSEKIIEGLKILKEALQKAIKFKNRFE